MPSLPQPVALTAMQALALPAAAFAGMLDGGWCNDTTGAMLFWEERSLGFGEHTMCDWKDPPAGRTDHATTIHCTSIYLNGEEVIRMDPKSHAFQARLLTDGTLEVHFNDDAAITLTRCDF